MRGLQKLARPLGFHTFDSNKRMLSPTSERILNVAERLFSERGFEGTSLRELTSAAGVNLAAVNYHFGSKEALFEAVFTRRFGPINAERLRLLDEAEQRAAGQPLPVETLLEAMVGPPLRQARDIEQGGGRFLCLLGRMHAESGELHKRIFAGPFGEVRDRFEAALRSSLPELSQQELFWRMHFCLAAMANAMASQARLALLSRGLVDGRDVEETVRRLVYFLSAGMRAGAQPAGSALRGAARNGAEA